MVGHGVGVFSGLETVTQSEISSTTLVAVAVGDGGAVANGGDVGVGGSSAISGGLPGEMKAISAASTAMTAAARATGEGRRPGRRALEYRYPFAGSFIPTLISVTGERLTPRAGICRPFPAHNLLVRRFLGLLTTIGRRDAPSPASGRWPTIPGLDHRSLLLVGSRPKLFVRRHSMA